MLKTLKDLQGTIGNAEYFHRKDIEPTDNYNEVVIVKELKAEAVKWAKHFKELDRNRILNDSINRYFNSGQLRFVVEFFNITEEDLKEEGKA